MVCHRRCGYVVQFLYGEDGMDATFIETQGLDIMKGKLKDFEKKYKHSYKDDNYGQEKGTYWMDEEAPTRTCCTA